MKESTKRIYKRCDEIMRNIYRNKLIKGFERSTNPEAAIHNWWWSYMKELTKMLNDVCETKAAEKKLDDTHDILLKRRRELEKYFGIRSKITFWELSKNFEEYNHEHDNGCDGTSITGVIVYKQSNWSKPYSEESRSYRVSSNNRAFQDGMIANSIFGHCLDGTDQGVRLDWYDWDIDYCYMD